MEQRKNVRPRAESRWNALGHNVASRAPVWNSCFDGPSLGDISLICHRVVKTGMYLKYKWNMTTVIESCTIWNAPEDIEHLFLSCTPAARTWKHFLPSLNKLLPFRVTKTLDLLLLRIIPVKVDRKSYLLVLYLIRLVVYQIWIFRCSHRLHQNLIQPYAIIKCTEATIKQRITLCFQAHSTASVKQMQIRTAKDALCTLDKNKPVIINLVEM